MIKIDVKKEKNLESALKKYKYKVLKTKQNEKIRERQEFVKPSVAKRSQKLKAIYKQEIKSNEEKGY
jgi:small subunit ribosomal protein S21